MATVNNFFARENAPCHFCGEIIYKGEAITWNRKKAGCKYHPTCLSKEEELEKEASPNYTPVVAPLVSADGSAEERRALLLAQIRQVVREELEAEKELAPKPIVKSEGPQHRAFSTLLKMAQARSNGLALNIWLAGPAGTGKTTAAYNVATSLTLPFYAMGSLSDPTQLVGYLSPVSGHYVTTPFRQAFENGGVILLDEIDGSDPNVLLVINQALANAHYGFADKVVARHKDCIVIACANTWGLGATNDYVGRLKLDAAFLDRFVSLAWDVDAALELATSTNKEWTLRVQAVRAKVKAQGIKVLVTPRASYYGAALLEAGLGQAEVEFATLRKGMTDAQWELVRA